jgi:glutathione S-transferase
MGDSITRADTTWLPFVELAARGGVDLDGATPALLAWRERMRARPSYERSYPPHWRTG